MSLPEQQVCSGVSMRMRSQLLVGSLFCWICVRILFQVADVLHNTHGVDALGYAVDITQEQEVASNYLAILERFGRIDGLINNAANNPKVENNSEKTSLAWRIFNGSLAV